MKPLISATYGVLLAALSAPTHAQSPAAESPVSFGIIGIVNGVDIVRVNAVLQPPDPIFPPDPCLVRFLFLDGEGNRYGEPEEKILRGGAAQSSSFVGNPDIRAGTRLSVRPAVVIGNPDEFPGCSAGVILTLEVFDRLTRSTRVLAYAPQPCYPPDPCQAPPEAPE